MRSLWAARAAVLVCLALGGVPVAAQEAPEPTVGVHISGTETIHLPVEIESQTQVGDVTQMRGVHATATERIDDPRLSGTATIDGNVDVYGHESVQWGTFRIENDGGAWEGPYRGVIYNGTQESATVWLAGSGDYAGLTCYWYMSGDNADLVLEIEGLVFPGEAPAP
jgi:hypothetical protein